MSEEQAQSIHYKHAAAAAEKIWNLYLNRDEPSAVRFGRILFAIQAASEAAAREMHEARTAATDN